MTEVEIRYKQFVVVPKRPKMSKGKIASQVAHATHLALKHEDKKLMERWEKSGMCVIVLECEDEIQLMNTAKYLKQWNIKHWEYIDEGLFGCRTMTATCLATGVLDADMHWIFSQFKLFNQ